MDVPSLLVEQLKPTGRLVIPIQTKDGQKLLKLKNTKNGVVRKVIEEVVFVPMLDGVEKNE